MAVHKKNDAVYRIAPWDHDGTFYIVPCHVYSCGQKRMVLEAENGKCIGRDFKPDDISVYPRNKFQTRAMVEEEALTLSQNWILAQIAFNVRKVGNEAFHQPSILENIERLKKAKPAFIWRED